ncbi:hypothetical protein TEA_002202 [Camellia sinensis var. sinensis]|uniref:Pentacotripeptide-repeat region of PRORP domain-containing protein n=1 Tax=Camellia sinensis var. sinensis TaxID=542762 RepID=A0A4S4DZB3_CAMSN|nr:hypothetical protein TEA_002202 [Camellia sinensis var. sinensis]
MPQRVLKPDIEMVNAMFKGLFRSCRCSNEMQVVGMIPNSQTYAIMLDGLCRNKNISEALALFHKMERNDLDFNVVMYNILIDTFCKDKKLNTTRALFVNLSSRGLQPNVKTYTMMIQDILSTKGQDPALQEVIKKLMSKDGHGMQEIK